MRAFNNSTQHRSGVTKDHRHQTLNPIINNPQGYKGSQMVDEEKQEYPPVTDRSQQAANPDAKSSDRDAQGPNSNLNNS